MNKTEWSNWINASMEKAAIYGPLGRYDSDVIKVDTLRTLINMIGDKEPIYFVKELPVIPQFVADWIEEGKALEYSLSDAMDCINYDQEKFARAWLSEDGYTIKSDETDSVLLRLEKIIETGGFDIALKERIREVLDENDDI